LNLLSDLTGLHAQSKNYEDMVERVCDDLLENADKQIDLLRQELENPEPAHSVAPIVRSEQFYQERPRTDHTMKKP